MTRIAKKGGQVDSWALLGCLGVLHSTKQSHRLIAIFPHLWVRSYPPYGHHVEVSKAGDVWRRRSWSGKTSVAWFSRRTQMQCLITVSSLPTRHLMLPWLQRIGEVLQHWQFGPPSHPRWDRASHVQLAIGRALHHYQSYATKVVPTTRFRWTGDTKLVEHRAPMSFLSLDNLYTKFSAAVQHVYQ
jgi:hypothetical protein